MKSIRYRILAMFLVILTISILGLLTRKFGSLEWLVENEHQLREFIELHPWRGWAMGFAVYLGLSLIPGTAGKSVVCGWLFGFWPAVVIVDCGLTLAAVGSFLIARFFIRDAVTEKFGRWIEFLNRGLLREGAFYLLMMRVAHVPFSFVNYAAGATAIPLRTFCWTSLLGILPGTMTFVFVGTRLPTLASISEQGGWLLLDPLVFALLAATLVLPILIRWAIHRFYKQPETPPEIEMAVLDAATPWFLHWPTKTKKETNHKPNDIQ